MQLRTQAMTLRLERPSCSGRSITSATISPCSRKLTLRIVAKSRHQDQKNDGVYFEYVSDTPKAPWVARDNGQFEWVKKARESAKKLRSTKESTSVSKRPSSNQPTTRNKQRKVTTAATTAVLSSTAPTSKAVDKRLPANTPAVASATINSSRPEAASAALDLAAVMASLKRLNLPDEVLAKAVADAEARLNSLPVDNELDTADGDLYDDDDEVDMKLRAVDMRTDISSKEKGRLKMQLLGFYPAEDEEDEDEEHGDTGLDEPLLQSASLLGGTPAQQSTTTGTVSGDPAPVLAAKPMLRRPSS